MTTSCTARTSMPRAVASVLMRLWGEELWALPVARSQDTPLPPAGDQADPRAGPAPRSSTHS